MTLFPRHQGGSHSREFALRCRAHRILDRARAGAKVEPGVITWALAQTGDVSERRGPAVREPQQEAA